MTLVTWFMVVALALALAADAFAVALCHGAAARDRLAPGAALKVGGVFGLAQALMPLAGWALGLAFAEVVRNVDHWIAFILLAGLGAKMLREAWTRDDCADMPTLTGWALLVAALATSIDAAAAGLTLPTLGAPVLLACAVIGGVTLAACAVGVRIGAAGGVRLGRRAEVAGGIVLIALGLKILVEHTLLAA